MFSREARKESRGMKKKLPTIRDVARLAGISPTSVSYILNAKPDHKFSIETLRKVQNAVDELGYAPNRLIKAIHEGKTRTIGIGALLPGSGTDLILNGIYEELEKLRKYDLLFYFSQGREQRDKFLFLDGRSDGVIFPEPLSEDIAGYLAGKGLPVVTLFKRGVAPGVGNVDADNLNAGKMAVDHLWALGHRKIAHFGGFIADWQNARDRMTGYVEALRGRGVNIPAAWIFDRGSWHGELAGDAIARWLALPEEIRPTAVFSANDAGAEALVLAAENRGVKVPDAFSIVGCDNHVEGRGGPLPITTINIDFAAIGAKAAALLVEMIEGKREGPLEEIVPVRLIERKTVARANNAS